MRWNKNTLVGTLCLLLLAAPLRGQNNPGNRHLWNVTANGDTLRYVNTIPSRHQTTGLSLPRYLTPDEFQQLMRTTSEPSDSQVVLTNLIRYDQIRVPRMPEARELEPSYARIWQPVVSMAVFGTLSAYFKLEANRTYTRYEESLDHGKIEKYYTLTRKYDTYSAISFVFLQGSFGWLIYKLLW